MTEPRLPSLAEAALLRERCASIPEDRSHPRWPSAVEDFLAVVALVESGGVDLADIAESASANPHDIRAWRRLSQAKRGTRIGRSMGRPLPDRRRVGFPAAEGRDELVASADLANTSIASRSIASSATSDTWSSYSLAYSLQRKASPTVLAVAGDHAGHRFDLEIGCIRDELYGTLADCRECSAVKPADLRGHLDRYRPAVVHIAAHKTFGGIHLVGERGREPVSPAWLVSEIAAARHRADLLVLSFCESNGCITGLQQAGCPRIIAAPGLANDDCSLDFATSLYRHLRGDSLADAFSAASASIASRWEGMYRLDADAAETYYTPWVIRRH